MMRFTGCAAAAVFLSIVPAVAFAADRYIEIVAVGERLLVRTADGGSFIPPLDDRHADEDNRQLGFRDARISPDGTVVGWLSLYPNCCTSYPIPLELVLARDGSVFQRIRGNGLPIPQWRFSSDGRTVALFQYPTHGDHASHFELRDVKTGALVEKVDLDPGSDPASLPEWARGLE